MERLGVRIVRTRKKLLAIHFSMSRMLSVRIIRRFVWTQALKDIRRGFWGTGKSLLANRVFRGLRTLQDASFRLLNKMFLKKITRVRRGGFFFFCFFPSLDLLRVADFSYI